MGLTDTDSFMQLVPKKAQVWKAILFGVTAVAIVVGMRCSQERRPGTPFEWKNSDGRRLRSQVTDQGGKPLKSCCV
jgi:hypothetical protein